MSIAIRWLGVAGYEIGFAGKQILIDPYVTRYSNWHLFFGTVCSNPALVERYIRGGDAIFVSHSHVDHVLDVPEIAAKWGIPLYGSENTLQIARLFGVRESLLHRIQPADVVQVGNFRIIVQPGEHLSIPFYLPGRLPRKQPGRMRARDLRMDVCHCFEIQVDGHTILTDPGIGQPAVSKVDVLFINPLMSEKTIARQLRSFMPRVVIPNHWDDFSTSLEKPVRGQLRPSLRGAPVLRFKLQNFTRLVAKTLPAARVVNLPRLAECSLDLETGSLVTISS